MAAMFVIAITLGALESGLVVHELYSFVVSGFLAAAATVLAAIFSTRPSLWHFALIVPSVDFIALGFLRYGTGGPGSAFAAYVILPVIWFAMEDGRQNALYAMIGTAIALFLPLIVGENLLHDPSEWLRAIISPVTFGLAAAIVNEVSRQARYRLDSMRQLAAEREEMLDETRDHTRALAASEAHLRELEGLMRNVWEAATEQIVVGTDLTGLIDVWNRGATRILGAHIDPLAEARYIEEFHLTTELDERAEALDFPLWETVANPRFAALIDRARQGDPDAGEWTYVRADGSTFPVHLSVTPRMDDSGVPVGYLFIGRDLTREREVNRLKDEFIGLISHELRTPLSSILGYLELMRDDDETELSSNQLQYLSVAERNANRLLRLVGDLLFTAQVDSGKFRVDKSEVDMSAIIRASIETSRPVAANAGVTVEGDGIPEKIVLAGDSVRLGQALDNLISNAVKFTPRGGTVTVGISTDAGNACISVSDTGIGIPADELDKLFGRFFRATTATKNAVPGVGLGLVITRAIVHAHGGEMAVRSEEGVGTTFEMTLPLAVGALVE
ncbi:PAS domain-containing sensor histidine kinase [Microbacterium sp. STN6]|uniref:sensor histidine kinase n=1 Tax=Microbacterium sp. STN6 TaxID=2995588 RepID=UPI0022609A95|nr:PAS domain-containing sensor histidine kinase [Microbacterium sp. STN6]MCX7522349.1 PAS domain-containing sensor histidine kinase [Microbacterium sp. STN6]